MTRARGRWKAWGRYCLLALLVLGVALWATVTQPMLSSSSAASSTPVDPARLEAHVRMLAETLAPRDYAHPENLDRVAAYVRAAFEKTGGRLSEQVYEVAGRHYRNVIASYGPESGERIVVGAHYDTCQPLPGADDNASGVAGLIELAQLIGRRAPSLRTDLVAFTLEEPPFFRTSYMGSRKHAAQLRADDVKLRGMISLEMIGYFSDEPGSQHFPSSLLELFYPTVGNYVAVVGRVGGGGIVRRVKRAMRGASSLPVYSLNGPRFVPGIDFSDHASYWDEGYAAAMVTDTAFFRNLAYHTPEDTADRLDYRRMALVVQGVYAAVLALAE